jgi:hypothetical protein
MWVEKPIYHREEKEFRQDNRMIQDEIRALRC